MGVHRGWLLAGRGGCLAKRGCSEPPVRCWQRCCRWDRLRALAMPPVSRHAWRHQFISSMKKHPKLSWAPIA